MEQNELQNIVKAIIQASNETVKLDDILLAFEEEERIDIDDVKFSIKYLLDNPDETQELVQIAGGYRYQIKQKFNKWIQKAKQIDLEAEFLSRAVSETVMYIAYNQPVSRADIDKFRGCQTHAMVYNQLEERGWIEVVEIGGERNSAFLYGTTDTFLEYFGLNSIFDLPPLESF